jgi:peptidoglycan-N-acetylglucosamine deacetylase
MTPPTPMLHRVPRHPHAAWTLALLSQFAAAALWSIHGWPTGLAAFAASHLVLLWGTFWPRSRMFSPALTRLPTSARDVWLTIDDGPSDDTDEILDLLDAHGARATFFLVGSRAAANPERVRAIAARGHGIGNHSQHHPSAWFWALGPRRMRTEVDECQRVLAGITGTPPRWFRAVVGMANPFTPAAMHAHGLARASWSARGFDAVEQDPDVVAARIESDLVPGAVVLLHEGARHGRSAEAVARVLQRLGQLGYRTVLPEDAGPATA